MAMVKNAAFVGSACMNLFHFHHYDMTNLVPYVNGVQPPSELLKWIALRPLELPVLTKHYFQVQVNITITVLTLLLWKCSLRASKY